MIFQDLTGRIFGVLVVERMKGRASANLHHSTWVCRCSCGKAAVKTASNLRRGKNIGCASCYRAHRRYRPFEALYNRLVVCAKRTTLDLSYEEFLEFTKVAECHYCGVALTWAPYSTKNGYQLDRADNDKGYSKTNCVVCCARCNRAKSDQFTYLEWLQIGTLIKRLTKRVAMESEYRIAPIWCK